MDSAFRWLLGTHTVFTSYRRLSDHRPSCRFPNLPAELLRAPGGKPLEMSRDKNRLKQVWSGVDQAGNHQNLELFRSRPLRACSGEPERPGRGALSARCLLRWSAGPWAGHCPVGRATEVASALQSLQALTPPESLRPKAPEMLLRGCFQKWGLEANVYSVIRQGEAYVASRVCKVKIGAAGLP